MMDSWKRPCWTKIFTDKTQKKEQNATPTGHEQLPSCFTDLLSDFSVISWKHWTVLLWITADLITILFKKLPSYIVLIHPQGRGNHQGEQSSFQFQIIIHFFPLRWASITAKFTFWRSLSGIPLKILLFLQGAMGVYSKHGQSPHSEPGP